MPKNCCFQVVVLEKTLESPLDSKEIQPSILREIKGLMLKLKLQYFGHLMRTAYSLEKSLMLDGITDVMDLNLSKLWEMVRDTEVWHAAVHRVTKSQTGPSN